MGGPPLEGPGSSRTAEVRAEFSALFREAHRSAWLTAFGLTRDRTLADDVVQEAAIVAFGKFAEFERGTNFGAWLSRIVQFVARNANRSHRRRRGASLDATPLEPEAAAPRAEHQESSMLSASFTLSKDQELFDDDVMAALGEVQETARACLLLRTVDGLEYSEIASLLGIPEGTAMSHVHRARQLLRARLSTAVAGGERERR